MSKEIRSLIITMVITSVFFLIPLYFGMPWLGVFMALIVAVAYMVNMNEWAKSEIQSETSKKVIGSVIGIMILVQVAFFINDFRKKDFQVTLLLEIREKIERGIILAEAQRSFIPVLENYYSRNEDESIEEIAREFLGDKFREDGTMATIIGKEEDDEFSRYYHFDKSRDAFVITTVGSVAPGFDPSFENKNGETGKIQVVATLTKGGIDYERQN